jgi:pimeloyl-ACP methyl ester carboxylesterase
MPAGGWFIRLLARPWIDPLCLWGLGLLLPASRLWAAAAKARGDRREIAKLAGIRRVSEGLAMRVARTEGLSMDSTSARNRWEAAVFGGDGDVAVLARARRRAAQAFLMHRFAYLIEALFRRTPAARFAIPTPAEARDEFAAALADPASFFQPSRPSPAIERGRAIDHGDVLEYWLRFEGNTDGARDRVYVHVYEPKEKPADRMPSLVFCHGLAMELEMLASPPRDFIALARKGLRVLLPDAPGHNRRCALGSYGGESFIRAAPASAIRHFREAALEFAAIVAWCREQGDGKVALGGISLGALSAQVAASRWNQWPANARADALILVTTTDEVSALPLQSSLARVAGLGKVLRQAGWNEDELARFAPLTDASDEAPVDPSAIVLVLGSRDDLTPIAGGRRLAEKWRVPSENLFLRKQGHFSAAIGLNADPAPFARILEILKA